MPTSRSILLFFGLFVTFSAASAPAEAMRIKNRDDVPHQISLSANTGDERVVEIAPGSIYTTYSPAVTLRLLTGEHTSTHHARFMDEYVIWPDGQLHLQKRRWPEHRAY